MDIFSFKNPNATMQMESGKIVNGLTSKMWIERYDEAGEFTLVGPVSAQLRQELPIGSFVSHKDTREVMIVENHEINDSQDQESKITITGRGFETYFEQRIVGSNRSFPHFATGGDMRFLLPAQNTWDQIVHLVNQHLSPGYLDDDTNSIAYFTINAGTIGVPGEIVSRRLDTRTVYDVMVELLKIDNLGVKIIRPGVWSPIHPSPNLLVRIHRGINRSAHVIFSYDTGEIVNADYLWSNKNLKTSALVTGKWVQTIVNLPGFPYYDRRMMEVDGSDLDDQYDEGTAAFVQSVIEADLKKRGREALKKQKDINLTKAETSKRTIDSRYRVDFDVGDIVTVVGDYNESTLMRITEFVEIEDENGSVSYPTLNLPNPEA